MAIVKGEISNFREILNLISKHSNINFIARVISPFHASSVFASILWIEETKNVKIKPIIVIAKHSVNGFVINESFFKSIEADLYFEDAQHEYASNNNEYRSISKIKKKVKRARLFLKKYSFFFKGIIRKNNKQELYYYTHGIHDEYISEGICDLGRRPIFLLGEEGCASYIGTAYWESFPPCPKPTSRDGIYKFRHFLRDVVFYRFAIKHMHEYHNCRLFISKSKKLIPNKDLIPYYEKAFKMCYDIVSLDVDKNDIEQSVILCTTAWYRDKIKEDEDLRVLKRICGFIREKGFHIFLKLHPRDTYFASKIEDLGCDLLDTKGLVLESVFTWSKPKAVISFSSTALITAKLIWNIPVYCLSKMLDREMIDEFYLEEIDGFYNAFEDNVKFIYDANEIILS